MRWTALLMLLVLAACAAETEPAAETLPLGAPEFDAPRDLIAAMRDRYDGQWYETLTFVQETIQYDAEGVADTSTWYEAYAAPGKLRIDFGDPAEGNGVLFANDMRYTFQNGEVTDARQQVHPLLLLGFDVYHLPADETASKLEALGFDLSKMHQAMWQDRPHYVVGAGTPTRRLRRSGSTRNTSTSPR